MSQKIINKRSSVITEDGKPKLPSSDALDYGEIAINYADGVETLSIKNTSDEVVEFKSRDYVDNLVNKLITDTELKFFCIEPVTVTINGESTIYEANSLVDVFLKQSDTFEIIPTSTSSIYALYAWPGALNVFYDWLEGVNLFDGILFDMNSQDMYVKWNQGHQEQYHVQFAQYKNCIFWSDNPYISQVDIRTNYTIYYSSELPLCYSTIPENTFKAFFLAYNVTCDPNWSNPLYKESFAAANWATQVFSYYGMHSIGMFDLDSDVFNITLPKDCRGLMFYAPNVLNAGVFDAINVTNFGAKSGSWRDAFGYCYQLTNLYIKNLKVNLNVSWSPINQQSIEFILSNAANTNAITIWLSPHTYYSLTETNKTLAIEKNITLSLIDTNTTEDKRLSMLQMEGDGTQFLSDDGTYKEIIHPEPYILNYSDTPYELSSEEVEKLRNAEEVRLNYYTEGGQAGGHGISAAVYNHHYHNNGTDDNIWTFYIDENYDSIHDFVGYIQASVNYDSTTSTYIVSFVKIKTENAYLLTSETYKYSDLEAAIDQGKQIIFQMTSDSQPYIVHELNRQSDGIMMGCLVMTTDGIGAAIVGCGSDDIMFEPYIQEVVYLTGDGNSFLANDGTYKEIEAPQMNIYTCVIDTDNHTDYNEMLEAISRGDQILIKTNSNGLTSPYMCVPISDEATNDSSILCYPHPIIMKQNSDVGIGGSIITINNGGWCGYDSADITYIKSGDGTKFLSDDGTYKTINVDTSAIEQRIDGVETTIEENELVTSTALNELNARMTDVETNKASSTHDHDDRYLTEHQDISHLATQDELNSKQDTLVSGTNIKTINGQSILGSGNIETTVDLSNYSTTEQVQAMIDASIITALNTEV